MTVSRRQIRWLLCFALVSACTSATRPGGEFSAVPTAEGIRATNGTNRPVLYRVYEQSLAGAIDYIPCDDVATCPSIPGGEAVTIPWSTVPGYGAARHTYLVQWHHAPPAFAGRPSGGTLEVSWP
jgi:hypothetical protein